MILALMATIMFFMAYREKSNAPRPGSPEYEAIERAQAAKIEAQKKTPLSETASIRCCPRISWKQ